jgi:hypothetical protein
MRYEITGWWLFQDPIFIVPAGGSAGAGSELSTRYFKL